MSVADTVEAPVADLETRLGGMPDTLKARYNWEAGQLVARLGRPETASERLLATLWLCIENGYVSARWAARLLVLDLQAAGDLLESHGHRRPELMA